MDIESQSHSESEEYQDSPLSKIEILKGELDQREYYFDELSNGARLLVISDLDTQTSVCGIRMEAGSYLEPDSHPGLAHYLEHMLFMGSEKYPKVNDYDSFIQENGGSNNAYTDNYNTVFTFEVSNQDSFAEALDRTLQFFIKPKFNPKYIEKELSAVHNEFESNIADDNWLFETLMQHLASPGHVVRRFCLGNKETLSKKNSREMLMNFYSKYYSANLMTVVIYTEKSVGDILKQVIPLIEAVENKSLMFPSSRSLAYPYPKSQLSKFVKYKCIGEKTTMSFVWFLPSEETLELKNCYSYFSSLLPDSWEGSFMKLLTDAGLIYSGSVDYITDEEIYTSFSLSLILTTKGEIAQKEIFSLLGAFISLIQAGGVQEWHYDQMKVINHLNFKYSEKREPLDEVEGIIADIPSKTGLLPGVSKGQSAGNLFPSEPLESYEARFKNILRFGLFMPFDRDILQSVADMFTPDRMIVFFAKKDQEIQGSQQVPHFNTAYECRELSMEELELLSTTSDPRLRLPSPNLFVPSEATEAPDFTNELYSISPLYFEAEEDYRLVYYRTTFENVPKCKISGSLRIEKAQNKEFDKFNIAFGQVLNVIITRETAELRDMFMFAGDRSSFEHNGRLINFNFEGYTSVVLKYIPLFLQKVEKAIQEASQKEHIFRDSMQQQIKTVTDKYYNQAVDEIAGELLTNLNDVEALSIDANLQYIKEASFEEFIKFTASLFENYHLSFYFAGYVDKSQGKQIIELFRELPRRWSGHPRILQLENIREKQFLDIKPGNTILYKHILRSESQVNGAIRLSYFCPLEGTKVQTYTRLLYQYLTEPFFNKFRTEEELGYTCYVCFYHQGGNWKLDFCIVSANLGTNSIVIKIQQFLQQKYQDLLKITDNEFQDLLDAVETDMTKSPLNIQDDWFDYDDREIFTRRYGSATQFTEEVKASIAEATKEKLGAYYSGVLLYNPKVLEVHVVPEAQKTAFEQAGASRQANLGDKLVIHEVKTEAVYSDGYLPNHHSLLHSLNHEGFKKRFSS